MSLISPIQCGTEYSFLNILKKVVKKDADGNYYVDTTGMAETVPPFPVNAEVGLIADGIIFFAFSEPLDETSIPALGDFVVNGMTNPNVITLITINASWIRIYLLFPVLWGDIITIDYTGGANPIQDLAGNLCADFVNFPVTNNTSFLEIAENMAAYFEESNREYISSCDLFLISQTIDIDYKNYLISKMLINI